MSRRLIIFFPCALLSIHFDRRHKCVLIEQKKKKKENFKFPILEVQVGEDVNGLSITQIISRIQTEIFWVWAPWRELTDNWVIVQHRTVPEYIPEVCIKMFVLYKILILL